MLLYNMINTKIMTHPKKKS